MYTVKAIFLWIHLISEHRPNQQEERISKIVLLAKGLARTLLLARLEQIHQLGEISTRPKVRIIFLAASKQKPENMIQVASEAYTAPICREGIMVQLEERATRMLCWILRPTLLIKLFQGGTVSERTIIWWKCTTKGTSWCYGWAEARLGMADDGSEVLIIFMASNCTGSSGPKVWEVIS